LHAATRCTSVIPRAATVAAHGRDEMTRYTATETSKAAAALAAFDAACAKYHANTDARGAWGAYMAAAAEAALYPDAQRAQAAARQADFVARAAAL